MVLDNLVIVRYTVQSGATSILDEGVNNLPIGFDLKQNYPNPFNPATNISFELVDVSQVSLKIYDASGRHITTIVDQQLSSGSHEFQWNAENMASGVYFYTLEAGEFSETRKMILSK